MHLNENICTIAFKGSFKIFFPTFVGEYKQSIYHVCFFKTLG